MACGAADRRPHPGLFASSEMQRCAAVLPLEMPPRATSLTPPWQWDVRPPGKTACCTQLVSLRYKCTKPFRSLGNYLRGSDHAPDRRSRHASGHGGRHRSSGRCPAGRLLAQRGSGVRDLRRCPGPAGRGRLRPDEHGLGGRAGAGQQGDHLPALARQARAASSTRFAPASPTSSSHRTRAACAATSSPPSG